MDATTHINIDGTKAMGDHLAFRIMVDGGGQDTMFIHVIPPKNKKDTCVSFSTEEWSRFKECVIAVDQARAQLREKGLIFDFKESTPEPEVKPDVPPKKDTVRIISHVVEKMTAAGIVERRECSTLAEIEEFARQ